MSGTTGAAGGAAPGGAPFGGVPQPSAEHPAASTSVMSSVGSTGGYSGGTADKPTVPPPGQSAAGGYSQPTTYTKGQPAAGRGTRAPGQAGQSAPRPAAAAPSAGSGRTRKARLRVLKADPWSVMKVSFLLSLALGIIMIVAAIVLWSTLDTLGVFDSIGKTLKEVTGSGSTGTGGVNIMDYVGFGQVLTWTALIAVVDVVLLTALSTLAAFIYNSAAGFTGGVELTLAEEE
ncbi:DUF3566 domain-containing protein [Kitasatospora sp. RB6PN24]|uniref:DUF3566 domain-containing protein n=1 Tax=Kitasatospora humi TaxID=2893891 RepID=UPI001E602715|nr:DUF3566 domain-containing protein [Kitasatospora humi]MCC9308026.1 DUF3566 domain-containing protein [Kitasatospora humi]